MGYARHVMRKSVVIAIAAVVLILAVVVVVWSRGDRGPESGRDSTFSAATADPPADSTLDQPKQPALPLPDPRLGETKMWEPEEPTGPPPEGFSTHLVQQEKLLQDTFRRHLADAIELCVDEMRRRGQDFEGKLLFNASVKPGAGLTMGFKLNGIQVVDPGESAPDAGHSRPTPMELPADVYQCMWDTIEAMEVRMPFMAASILGASKSPEILVDYDVREQSPAGPVEIEAPVDAGRTVAAPDVTVAAPDFGAD